MCESPLLILLFGAHLILGQSLQNCTAFSSNGLVAAQYQYYRFYDFRHMTASQATSTGTKGSQAKVVTDASWKDDWYIRDFPRKSPGGYVIPVNFVPDKVYITNETDAKLNYTSYLSLNTERVDDETQDSGEITFKEFNASYALFRVSGRVRGAPGAVAGIFTYLNDTQESDIEIFTRAPTQYIQYSNQPSSTGEPDWTEIPGATVNATMPHAKQYTDWHIHRLDWTPGKSAFFLDDEQMNTTTLHVPVADPPSGLYLDMWSANSTWSGSMDIGKNATFDIQWIEIMFNTTKPLKTATTPRVCAVDKGDVVTAQQSGAFRVCVSLWSISAIAIALVVAM